jgi:hypothetical protein
MFSKVDKKIQNCKRFLALDLTEILILLYRKAPPVKYFSVEKLKIFQILQQIKEFYSDNDLQVFGNIYFVSRGLMLRRRFKACLAFSLQKFASFKEKKC